MGAFELFGRMQENREQAWKDYYTLCCAGGSLQVVQVQILKNINGQSHGVLPVFLRRPMVGAWRPGAGLRGMIKIRGG